jgi:hypothetical protein
MHCPRCNSPAAEMMTRSATAAWEVFLCPACFYSWRTSEAAEFTRHELYNEHFRLTPELIARFADFPAVTRPKRPGSTMQTPANTRPPRRGGTDV